MKILIDPKYDPAGKEVTSKLALGPGVTMAKFLGSRGTRTQIDKLYNDSFSGPPDLNQIARNLVLHSQIIQVVMGLRDFSSHRFTVSEGIYEPNPKFEISEIGSPSEAEARVKAKELGGSFGKGKDGWPVTYPQYVGEKPFYPHTLMRVGRCVVYQLIDRGGKTDPAKTFDLAVYLKDYVGYDQLTLDYDTYNVDGSLTSQIVIETPNVPESYEVDYQYKIETKYNGQLQATNELLEILPD